MTWFLTMDLIPRFFLEWNSWCSNQIESKRDPTTSTRHSPSMKKILHDMRRMQVYNGKSRIYGTPILVLVKPKILKKSRFVSCRPWQHPFRYDIATQVYNPAADLELSNFATSSLFLSSAHCSLKLVHNLFYLFQAYSYQTCTKCERTNVASG